jgi:hypothetical protein
MAATDGLTPPRTQGGCAVALLILLLVSTSIAASHAGETPVPRGDSSLQSRDQDQRTMTDRFLILNRPPATPSTQLLGGCLFGMGILAVALGTYHIVTGRLAWVLLYWAAACVLIPVGMTEYVFGDGPVSSFLRFCLAPLFT